MGDVFTGGGIYGSTSLFGGGIYDGTQAGFGAVPYESAAAGIGQIPFEQASAGIGAWDRPESYKDGVFMDRNGMLRGELQSYREGSLGQMYEQAAAGIGVWEDIEAYREGSLGLDGYGAGEEWLGGYGAGEDWLGALGQTASCCDQLKAISTNLLYKIVDQATYTSIMAGVRSGDPAALDALRQMNAACCNALREEKSGQGVLSTKENIERNLDCSGKTGLTARILQVAVNEHLEATGESFTFKGKTYTSIPEDGMWGPLSCAAFCATAGRAPIDSDLDGARSDFKDLGIKKCSGGQDIHVPSCSCEAVVVAPPPPPVREEPPVVREPPKKGFSAAWIVGGLLGAAAIAGIYAATKKKKAA